MEKLKNRTWQYYLEIISPVHVGSGVKWRKGLDFFEANEANSKQQRVWLIDLNADGFETIVKDTRKQNALEEFTSADAPDIAQWAANNRIDIQTVLARDSGNFIISYRGQAGSSQLFEFLRSGAREPIIPGSSLKGALATALLCHLNRANKSEPARAPLLKQILKQKDANEAARPLIENTFILDGEKVAGKGSKRGNDREASDAHRDLKRVFRVSDLTFSQDDLTCSNIQVWNVNRAGQGEWRRGLNLSAETLMPGASSIVKISIDDFLLYSTKVQQEINFAAQKDLFDRQKFAKIANRYAERQIRRQMQYYLNYGQPKVAQFYRDKLLAKLKELKTMPGNLDFMLRLSWGSGWQAMTGELFHKPREMEGLRNKREFKLRRAKFVGMPDACPKCHSQNLEPDDQTPLTGKCRGCNAIFAAPSLKEVLEPIFPKTRKLVVEGREATPFPLGWVILRVSPPTTGKNKQDDRTHLVPVLPKPQKSATPPKIKPEPPAAVALPAIAKGEKLRAKIISVSGDTYEVELLQKDFGRKLNCSTRLSMATGNIIQVRVDGVAENGKRVTKVTFDKFIKAAE